MKLNNMDNKQKIYCCYSMNLKNYLSENGIRYELEAMSKSTHKTFWLYVLDDNLKQLLHEWSARK